MQSTSAAANDAYMDGGRSENSPETVMMFAAQANSNDLFSSSGFMLFYMLSSSRTAGQCQVKLIRAVADR